MTKRAYGLWLVLLVFLMVGNAGATDFTLLDPALYNAGDTIEENLIVRQGTDGKKYFTADTADRLGRVEFPVMLSGDFEVEFYADWKEDGAWGKTVALISDEIEIKVLYNGGNIGFYGWDPGVWVSGDFINSTRLSVKGGIAKLEINGRTHSQYAISNPYAVFTKLSIGGIKPADRLFEITVKKGDSSLTAYFAATYTTVTAGNSVKFTDFSTCSPEHWNWNFPGGTPSSSSDRNPTVTYSTPGKYDVTLTVSMTVRTVRQGSPISLF
jgi:hypothetical protein